MAYVRLAVRKIKEILRLGLLLGLSQRKIAASCRVSTRTVSVYLIKAREMNLSWPLPNMDEESLQRLFFSSKVSSTSVDARDPRLLPDPVYIHQELKKKGVTLRLLWEEYKKTNPDGPQYSQFCEYHRRFKKTLAVSMRQEHKAGEKCFIDFAGQTMVIRNSGTGEIQMAYLFVAVLGASNYTYAEAFLSQNLFSWITGQSHALDYFDGVPEIMVPDNPKSLVTKPCRYEPLLNRTYQEFSEHYGFVIIPARVRRPKDKAKVEVGVQIAERWILAALRNRIFFSLEDFNKAIQELLTVYNNKRFQKLDGTRRSHFENLDKPALRPLPTIPYQFAEWNKVRPGIDYHIEVDRRYYSVPFSLRGWQLDLRKTSTTIEVLHKGKVVACHERLKEADKRRFITIPEHMPPNHRYYAQWSPEKFLAMAEENGSFCRDLIEAVLKERKHPEQGFRSCLGILKLQKEFGKQRLEKACERALRFRAYSYRSVLAILKNGLDRVYLSQHKNAFSIDHENIRGPDYYKKEVGDVSSSDS